MASPSYHTSPAVAYLLAARQSRLSVLAAPDFRQTYIANARLWLGLARTARVLEGARLP